MRYWLVVPLVFFCFAFKKISKPEARSSPEVVVCEFWRRVEQGCYISYTKLSGSHSLHCQRWNPPGCPRLVVQRASSSALFSLCERDMEDSWPYFNSHISHVENDGRTWEVKVLVRSLCLAFRLCLYSLSLCLSLSHWHRGGGTHVLGCLLSCLWSSL